MDFNEVVEAFEGFKDTEDFENYVGGLVTADRVSKFLETEDGKKFIQPTLDKYHNKGLEAWKQGKEFKSLVDAKIKELYPDADPKDTALAELKAELEAIKAESARKDLTNKALTIATEKKLPIELIDFFVGADEEATTENLNKLETAFNDALEKLVTEKLGQSHKPDSGDDFKGFDITKLAGLSIDEINKQINAAKKMK